MELRAVVALAQHRQQRLDHPQRRLFIGAIIHLAGKDEMRPRLAGEHRMRANRGGIEESRVDAIADHLHVHPGRIAQPRTIKRRLGFGDQDRRIGALAEAFFLRREQPRLAGVEPHALAALRIAGELGAIDVAQVDDDAARKVCGDVLSHLAREHDDRLNLVARDRFAHPAFQLARMERGEAHRLACQHRLDSGERQRLGARGDAMRGGEFGQCRIRRRIAFAKAADMDRPKPRQRLQQVVRTDPVTAIRWKRHAVGKEQDVAHHASPRAIHGPTVLATGSGSFFHSSILRE